MTAIDPSAWDEAAARTGQWIEEHGLRPGPVDADEARRFLLSAVAGWIDRLTQQAAAYSSAAVLVEALGLHEQILREHESLLSGPAEDRAELGLRGEQSTAARILVELFSALPPEGRGSEVPEDALETLWAGAVQLHVLGTHLDELAAGLNPPHVVRAHGTWTFAVDPDLERSHAEHIDASLRQAPLFDDVPRGREAELWGAVDRAFEEHHGFGLTTLQATLLMLEEAARDGLVVGSTTPALAKEIAPTAGCSAETTGKALESLWLTRRDGFAAQQEDMPWRHRRRRSLLRCPLVRLDDGRLLWTAAPARAALVDLQHRVRRQQLAAETPALQQALGQYANWVNARFAESVEIVLRCDLRLRARRLRALPGAPHELGDVDVLVVAPSIRVMVLVEAKANAPAQTPHELRRELPRLRQGTSGRRTDLDHVMRRERHAREQLTAVLAAAGVAVDDAGDWSVGSVFVYEREMWGPRLEPSPVPAVSLTQLRAEPDLQAWLQRLAKREPAPGRPPSPPAPRR